MVLSTPINTARSVDGPTRDLRLPLVFVSAPVIHLKADESEKISPKNLNIHQCRALLFLCIPIALRLYSVLTQLNFCLMS